MPGPTCEEVNRFLAEYIEGVLVEETRVKFEQHIDRCKCCGPYLEDYRTTIAMAKASDDVKVPEALVDHTLEFLRSRTNDA